MSYHNPRLKDFSASLLDVIISFSEGNLGAVWALTEVVTNAETVDPDSLLGGLGPICMLDNLDCYGPRIWMLYKDVCGCDVRKMIGILRCCQMGFASDAAINRAIDGDRTALDIHALLTQLKDRLPAFQIEAPIASAA